jgi:hypothetical protein
MNHYQWMQSGSMQKIIEDCIIPALCANGTPRHSLYVRDDAALYHKDLIFTYAHFAKIQPSNQARFSRVNH